MDHTEFAKSNYTLPELRASAPQLAASILKSDPKLKRDFDDIIKLQKSDSPEAPQQVHQKLRDLMSDLNEKSREATGVTNGTWFNKLQAGEHMMSSRGLGASIDLNEVNKIMSAPAISAPDTAPLRSRTMSAPKND